MLCICALFIIHKIRLICLHNIKSEIVFNGFNLPCLKINHLHTTVMCLVTKALSYKA